MSERRWGGTIVWVEEGKWQKKCRSDLNNYRMLKRLSYYIFLYNIILYFCNPGVKGQGEVTKKWETKQGSVSRNIYVLFDGSSFSHRLLDKHRFPDVSLTYCWKLTELKAGVIRDATICTLLFLTHTLIPEDTSQTSVAVLSWLLRCESVSPGSCISPYQTHVLSLQSKITSHTFHCFKRHHVNNTFHSFILNVAFFLIKIC